VKSTVGAGTTFTIQLPVDGGPSAAARRAIAAEGAQEQTPALQK
jgi:hypothetical protein